MSDARHKRPPPPSEEEEDVTDAFRDEVNEALKINAAHNRLRRLKKEDHGYKIRNQAELADAIGADPNLMRKMFGAVRGGSKPTVNRSAYVRPIREVLELAPVSRITVRTSRSSILQFLAELPDDQFKIFEDEVKRLMK